jgi:excinuclease ABC subunit C
MITLVDGAFKPAEYKKFKIEKTLGHDDTAYMKEAVARRLQRYNDGDEKFAPLPDLIICDGALGQIHAVEDALMMSGNHVPVVGLKKDSKHRTKSLVFSSGKEMPLVKHREAFAFCTRLQDEVHRYAISYHKNLRDALTRQSSLTKIPGIGKKRARELFLKFKSVEKIGAASIEELCKIKGINENLAKTVIEWIKENY